MTFDPHFRLTWSGTLPDGEIWSNSLSLVPDDDPWKALIVFEAKIAYLTNRLTDVNLTDDIVADVSAYHSHADSRIHESAVMKRVTLAAIGEDGRYAAAPAEAAVNVAGGRQSVAQGAHPFPHQVARKITLETDVDLGRVKGGWYQPRPTTEGWAEDTNLWDAGVTATVRDRVKTFLDDLQNAPGLDANSFRVVIASQGRHNKDGSVRLGPTNANVERVNVGRRVDIQRRRANKLSEARIADAALAPA